MVKTEKIVVKIPSIGFMSLVGYLNPENRWPMKRGNCFSMIDSAEENIIKPVEGPVIFREVGRVVNIRAEDFTYLIKNYPNLIENLEVEVLSIDPEHKYVFITDERLKDWLVCWRVCPTQKRC